MKDITTEVTLKITFHEKVDDHDADEYIQHDLDPKTQKKFTDAVATSMGADKVDIIGKVKHFVRDDVEE